jgi:hypothetical protein
VESHNLMDLISTLSGEEQAVVEEFIKYLKAGQPPATMGFRAVLDSFVREHSELLRQLSQ